MDVRMVLLILFVSAVSTVVGFLIGAWLTEE